MVGLNILLLNTELAANLLFTLLWSECPPKILCWNQSPTWWGPWRSGIWKVIGSWGWNPHEGDECPYESGPRELPSSFHHVRTQWKGADSHLAQTQPAPWSWICQPPELWESKVLLLHATQLVSICYSSPRKLIQEQKYVSVHSSCSKKIPPMGWLTQQQEFISHSSGIRKSNVKLLAGQAPRRGSRGDSLPSLFQLLLAPGIPWPEATSLQSLLLSHITVSSSVRLCVFVSPHSLCFSLTRIRVIAFRAQ